MFLLGQLAKVQGLKGEVLLHAVGDAEGMERLPERTGLFLAPPELDLQHAATAPEGALAVTVRSFRWHQDRPCLAFRELPDRTAVEPRKGWALWMPEDQAELDPGESYRHDWIGCEVYVKDQRLGEVLRLDPTPMGYDMVVIHDRRPGRVGTREVPYIKAWWTLHLDEGRLDLDPPEGLLDLDRVPG